MKLVMVTTSHAHWDGLTGNTAMFSEAVVPATILDKLPDGAVDTIFIKKDPQTRKFEKAWKGKTLNFKRINKQERDYLSFDIEDLKRINCPETLRTKTVGCHIYTENAEAPQVAPKRPMATTPVIKEGRQAPKEHLFEKNGLDGPMDTPIITFTNGFDKSTAYEETTVSSERVEAVNLLIPPTVKNGNGQHYAVHNGVTLESYADDLSPAFFSSLLNTNDPGEFEKYCYLLLRLLGIHDIHRPVNHAGADSNGFFKFSTLSVMYTTTLVPAVIQENRMVVDHYLNLLKKDKMHFGSTYYTLKDTQKQVWVICRQGESSVLLRTEDGIKLKLVPVQQLISVYRQLLENEHLNADSMWEKMKNI